MGGAALAERASTRMKWRSLRSDDC
jgi:hypothetical protein